MTTPPTAPLTLDAAPEQLKADYRSLYEISGCIADVNTMLIGRDELRSQAATIAQLEADVQRLKDLINTPHTADWVESSKLEAAHQVERWSADQDAGKQPEDWFWLLGYLGGKAVAAFRAGNTEKGLHHIVSSSAALLNWHRNVTGDNTAMRPGIDAAIAAHGKDAP